MNNNEYNDLLEFWNKALTPNGEPKAINYKWIQQESFNNMVKEYIKEDAKVLDYGCGSGWAIFELFNTIKLGKSIGIDPANKIIEFNNACAKLSNFNNLEFICGDEKSLSGLDITFDNIISFNVLDVLPIEIIHNILSSLKTKIKNDGYLIIGVNPSYPIELLQEMNYQVIDNKLYKDNILRGQLFTNDEWINIFTKYFSFIELKKVAITKNELTYLRRVFILKNNK